ncbi:hypothetical protein, partial [Lacrimispora sp.]|uniref:hypothetical protein n=1 Tax=Lacrimispora sp. TaxID=2719234 RepID=UPI0028B0FF7D
MLETPKTRGKKQFLKIVGFIAKKYRFNSTDTALNSLYKVWLIPYAAATYYVIGRDVTNRQSSTWSGIGADNHPDYECTPRAGSLLNLPLGVSRLQ